MLMYLDLGKGCFGMKYPEQSASGGEDSGYSAAVSFEDHKSASFT